MRPLPLVLSAFALGLLVGCAGNAGTTPSSGAAPGSASAGAHLPDSGLATPHFLRLMHTPPHPPPRRHVITAAMRERARKGGWEPVSGVPDFPNGPQTEELMTDGTVLVFDYCSSTVYKLAPDSYGNYVDGTWSQPASLPSGYAPLYFGSAVLPDGKLIVNGGEYNFCNNVESNLGAIYDPVANTWTSVTGPSGWSQIGDAQSVVLTNGTYMLGNCCNYAQALLNEASMSWTLVGTGKQDQNSEEGWTLLPNGNVLVVNVFDPPYAQYYSPKANEWEPAGQTPDTLVTGYEIGPQTLQPNGNVFVAGATGNTAIYNSSTGAWTAGPSFPVINGQQVDVADGPSSLLTDGTVMVVGSPGLYNTPATFYIFNGKKLKSIVTPPDAPNDSSYNVRLLMLPTGQVMEDDGSSDIELYSGEKVQTKYAPQIISVPKTLSPGSTYKITGRLFNGMSQDNMYGDDVQQATNYALVRITNNASGQVFYAKTHDPNFMGVASMRKVSTMFDVPSTIETGASSLVVVTNGIPSMAVSVTIQ
jgi:hypothetical protein